MFKRILILSLTLLVLFNGSLLHATELDSDDYTDNMKLVLTRGIKNSVSSPAEIPLTVAEHSKEGHGRPPVLREVAGLVDGSFQTIERLGSGLWDLFWAFVPGNQDGVLVEPEVLF